MRAHPSVSVGKRYAESQPRDSAGAEFTSLNTNFGLNLGADAIAISCFTDNSRRLSDSCNCSFFNRMRRTERGAAELSSRSIS
ncbi:hypothetical protein HYPGJ_20067 [Hyphomicrobium sp. GJ21]|nr:hypothetical protein HYPGJ_20067 [Hyphomicrobium sp. GJ21]